MVIMAITGFNKAHASAVARVNNTKEVLVHASVSDPVALRLAKAIAGTMVNLCKGFINVTVENVAKKSKWMRDIDRLAKDNPLGTVVGLKQLFTTEILPEFQRARSVIAQLDKAINRIQELFL